MKIILNRDVSGLGAAGDVREVAAGFARNYLVPRRLAWAYSEGMLKSVEIRKAVQAKKISDLKQKALEQKTALEKISLEFTVKLDEQGKMYGSIARGQVLKALRQKGVRLPRGAKLLIKGSIKATGNSTAPIQLHRDVIADIPMAVLAAAPAHQ
ncbi:MAG: 50S ribosomal protein L9 [Elusimicrobia bacterium]|nr:50S ribosomal protein L9 [Elusimicrobiota bacterium]